MAKKKRLDVEKTNEEEKLPVFSFFNITPLKPTYEETWDFVQEVASKFLNDEDELQTKLQVETYANALKQKYDHEYFSRIWADKLIANVGLVVWNSTYDAVRTDVLKTQGNDSKAERQASNAADKAETEFLKNFL